MLISTCNKTTNYLTDLRVASGKIYMWVLSCGSQPEVCTEGEVVQVPSSYIGINLE